MLIQPILLDDSCRLDVDFLNESIWSIVTVIS